MGAIHLVRHGQASFGTDDYDRLSELGFEQARVTGLDLEARGITPDAIVHGTLRRQRETAETLRSAAGWDCPLQTDDRLDEYDVLVALAAGQVDSDDTDPDSGADGRDAKTRFQDVLDHALGRWVGTDEFAEYEARVCAGMADLARRAGPGRTIVAVSSAGSLTLPIARLLAGRTLDGSEPGDPQLWIRLQRTVPNCGVARLVSGRGGVTTVALNEQQHLEQAAGERALVTLR